MCETCSQQGSVKLEVAFENGYISVYGSHFFVTTKHASSNESPIANSLKATWNAHCRRKSKDFEADVHKQENFKVLFQCLLFKDDNYKFLVWNNVIENKS